MPGQLELGVHIADVTSFLHPDTAMDDEAKRRGTTTYLVQRRLDMLPKPDRAGHMLTHAKAWSASRFRCFPL